MIKIIINGEAHNSLTMPKLVWEDLGRLSVAGKRVVIASEDEGELDNKVELREYADKMRRVKSELEKENPDLLKKICSEDGYEDEVTFFTDELQLLTKKMKTHGLTDTCGGKPLNFVERIASHDGIIAANGGYERIKAYAELFCGISEETVFEVFSMDNKVEFCPELMGLFSKLRNEGGLFGEEMERFKALHSDPEIERERVTSMSKSCFEKCVEHASGDVVLYVYPIGSAHVEGLAAKLSEMLAESGIPFTINAHRMWDEEGQKEAFLKEDPSLGELFSGGRAVDLVLSRPHRGGYNEIFSEIFPDLRPSPSCTDGGAAACVVGKGKSH